MNRRFYCTNCKKLKSPMGPSEIVNWRKIYIYSICSCCWNVTTYKWIFNNGKIEIIFFCQT